MMIRSNTIMQRVIATMTRPSGSQMRVTSAAATTTTSRFFSDSGASSITYSGGQATEGQGGYYGSGGARHIPPPDGSTLTTDNARSKLLALAADVQKVHQTMTELETLEQWMLSEHDKNQNHSVNTTKSLEVRAAMKKLMTQHDFLESLNRLEVQGEPVWGLSTAEREMIILARKKVNDS